MPDKERLTSLVRTAQRGDDLAFAELVRSYQDIAVAYATSILGDYHLAVQQADTPPRLGVLRDFRLTFPLYSERLGTRP